MLCCDVIVCTHLCTYPRRSNQLLLLPAFPLTAGFSIDESKPTLEQEKVHRTGERPLTVRKRASPLMQVQPHHTVINHRVV